MFSIPKYKGNVNQNNTEIPSYPNHDDNHQENNNKCSGGWRGKVTLLQRQECKLVQTLWKSVQTEDATNI
jgi:hypothetical protein